MTFVKVDPLFIEPAKKIKLHVTWRNLKIEISSKEDTYLAAELIKKLEQL